VICFQFVIQCPLKKALTFFWGQYVICFKILYFNYNSPCNKKNYYPVGNGISDEISSLSYTYILTDLYIDKPSPDINAFFFYIFSSSPANYFIHGFITKLFMLMEQLL
jgi:hypothetical protein